MVGVLTYHLAKLVTSFTSFPTNVLDLWIYLYRTIWLTHLPKNSHDHTEFGPSPLSLRPFRRLQNLQKPPMFCTPGMMRSWGKEQRQHFLVWFVAWYNWSTLFFWSCFCASFSQMLYVWEIFTWGISSWMWPFFIRYILGNSVRGAFGFVKLGEGFL